VKPQSLILLTIRAVDQSASDGDSRIIVERLDRALNRPANCHGGAVDNPIAAFTASVRSEQGSNETDERAKPLDPM